MSLERSTWQCRMPKTLRSSSDIFTRQKCKNSRHRCCFWKEQGKQHWKMRIFLFLVCCKKSFGSPTNSLHSIPKFLFAEVERENLSAFNVHSICFLNRIRRKSYLKILKLSLDLLVKVKTRLIPFHGKTGGNIQNGAKNTPTLLKKGWQSFYTQLTEVLRTNQQTVSHKNCLNIYIEVQ